jgi:hypothetical protein
MPSRQPYFNPALLFSPCPPAVFYDHLYENKHLRHLITRLIELRQRTGINCRSEVGEMQ